jgi:hypothetical protein
VDAASGAMKPLTVAPEAGARAFVSPDGSRFLMTGDRLRVVSASGVVLRDLGAPPESYRFTKAAWSPDGSSFSYIVARGDECSLH